MKKIIITGHQGSGKTKNAAALMQHFGATILIDEWDGITKLPDGALAFTNCATPNQSLADETYCIDYAIAAIQNNTRNDTNTVNFSI